MEGTGLYRGGWVATTDSWDLDGGPDDLRTALAGWVLHTVGPLEIRSEPSHTASHATAGDAEILLIGIAMDVERPDSDQDEVVARLARELDASWERFLEAIDGVGGAHVMFARAGGRLRIVQDATGMEAVTYDVTGGTQLISSHPNLIADLGGYKPARWAREWLAHPLITAGGVYFPGLRTLFDEVRILTPNTWFDAGTRGVERFFPREPLGQLPVDEILDRVAPMLTAQCRWLADRHPCLVSISGGLDSRLTLAASREVADRMRYFTYVVWNNKIHRNDIEVAGQLAERFGLQHDVWRITRGDKPDKARIRMWERVHGGGQGGGDFQANIGARFPPGHLQIRSNVLETMRGFYLKNPTNQKDRIDVGKLSRLFRVGTFEEFTPYFEEFVEVTGFDKHSKLDYHYTDLFYWEHRMGSWHGAMVRGLKSSHYSYVLYNCRKVLMPMMARPLEDRVSGVMVYRLIDRLWPELLEVPVYSGAKFAHNPLLDGSPAAAEAASQPETAVGALEAGLDPEPGSPEGPAVGDGGRRKGGPSRGGLRKPAKHWTAGQLAREAVRRATGRSGS